MRGVIITWLSCWALTHATGLEPVDVDTAQDSRSSAVGINEDSLINPRLDLEDTTLALPVVFNAPHNLPLPLTANQVAIESAFRHPPREMAFPPIAVVEAPPLTLKDKVRLENEKKNQAAKPSFQQAPKTVAKKGESKPAPKPKMAAKPVPKATAPAPKAKQVQKASKAPAPAPKAAVKQVQKAKPQPAPKKQQKKSGGGALENIASIGILGAGAAYLSGSGKDEKLSQETPPSGIRVVAPLMIGVMAGIGIIPCASAIFPRSGASMTSEEPLLS